MKKSGVIFLDFDGPLFSNRALMLLENNEYASENLKDLNLNSVVSYWYIDPVAVAMLIDLYRFRSFKFVVANAWAELHTKEQIENLLKKNGLGIPLHEDWKLETNDEITKAEKIGNWLSKNIDINYLVLDDIESGESFQNITIMEAASLKEENVVLVSYDDGILIKDFYKIKAILTNWE